MSYAKKNKKALFIGVASKLFLATLFVVVTGFFSNNNTNQPAPLSTENATLLRAKGYLDVSAGRYVTPAEILVKGEEIVSVNPSKNEIPRDIEVHDLGDATLLPGLIDAHVHLTFDINDPDWEYKYHLRSDAERVLGAIPNVKATLLSGFTTVADCGSENFSVPHLKWAVNEGIISGPDILTCAHAITCTGCHIDNDKEFYEKGPMQGLADTKDEAVKAIRYQIKHGGADFIKVIATNGVLSSWEEAGKQQYSFEMLKFIIEEAHFHGLPVAVHAHGPEGIKAAILAGADRIEHGALLTPELIGLIKKHNVTLVPTIALTYESDTSDWPPVRMEKWNHVTPEHQKVLEVAIREGVHIVCGTDAGLLRHGENAKEITAYVRLGMTEVEAIRSATMHAAETLRLYDRGVLKPGMRADIIAVDGNPLENVEILEDVTFVMKAGTIVKK